MKFLKDLADIFQTVAIGVAVLLIALALSRFVGPPVVMGEGEAEETAEEEDYSW